MMKSLIPFILSTITVICFQNCAAPFDVQNTDSPPNFSTDPVFQPYIQEFEYYYGSSTAHVPIAFEELDGNKAGVCYRSFINGRVLYAYIKIDSQYWPTLSEYQKINLIFHELGHCVMHRDHVPSNSVSLCPSSFMYDTIMSTSCLQNNYQLYMEEMFP